MIKNNVSYKREVLLDDISMTRPLSREESAQKQSMNNTPVRIGSVEYMQIPEYVQKELLKNGKIHNKYLETIKKNYEARSNHKVYYDQCMADNGISSDDPLPNEEFIRRYLLSFPSFLFGEFGVLRIDAVDPYKKGGTDVVDMINVDGLNNIIAFLKIKTELRQK